MRGVGGGDEVWGRDSSDVFGGERCGDIIGRHVDFMEEVMWNYSG